MIICAAVKFKNVKTGTEAIVHCLRHHHAFETIRDLGFKPGDLLVIDQGFINHKGEFLNRKDAMKHALDCGQLCATTRETIGQTLQLFSEDLY